MGASDGWRDLMENFRMDWEFGSATEGNVAVMGSWISAAGRGGGYEFTLALGIGEGHTHGGAEDHHLTVHAVRATSQPVH